MTPSRTLYATLIALLLTLTARAEEPGSWVDAHAQAIQSATPETLVKRLTDASIALTEQRAEIRTGKEMEPLVAALGAIATDAPLEVRALVWRAAALTCHPRGLAILEEAAGTVDEDAVDIVRGLANATLTSRCGSVHAWFIAASPRLWHALRTDGPESSVASEALRAAVYTAAGDANLVDASRGAGKVAAALKATLKKTEDPLRSVLLIAMAETPARSTRQLLKKWMTSKAPSEATMIAVLEALGQAGDADAVPLLLSQIEDTSPAVLEAALVGLFALPSSVLGSSGRKILTLLFKAFDEEGRESGSLASNARRTGKQEARLYALKARYPSWQTRSILDTPPIELPEGATGVAGVNALIWRILDAGPKGINPPEPPKDARPQYLNGRPHLPGRHWSLWWKNAR